MSFTKITSRVIAPGAVTAEALAPGVGGGPAIANVQIANSSYSILDDTAVSLSGGYIIINGENFDANVQVLVGNTVATSVTYVSENQVRAEVGAAAAGSKIVYLVNTDTGATAIRVNGLTYSGTPTWVTGSTLTESLADEAISIQLSATSDSNVSYSLVSGSSLPPGISLAANGLLSGTVTGLENDTTYNFTIEAIDQENQESPRSFSVNILVSDPFFNRNVLLLSGDGTNGAQNNTFLDGSSNNFTITRNGNTTQGTFSPFSVGAGEWSNYFDGSGDYLSFTGSSALQFGTGDWTVEFWVYMSSLPTQSTILDLRGSASAIPVVFNVFSTKFSFYNGSAIDTSGITPVANTWYHVAYVKSSGTTNIYVNGTSYASVADSVNYNTGTGTIMIGRGQDVAAYYLTGYISNLRVVKGTAVYTSNFTPSTTPLTNITNTSLLTCQSNRFVDNSTNAFAITRNGDVRVTPFSPFAPTAAYSAGTNGGSGYFDGSGDELNAGSNSAFAFGTGAYTVEFWTYLNVPVSSTHQPCFVFNNTTGGFGVWNQDGNGIAVSGRATTPNILNTNVNLVPRQWNHVAVVRSSTSSNQLFVFINGSLVATGTDATNWTVTGPMQIGGITLNDYYLNGYVSNLRIVKGTAVYTSAFTPPTAPLTAITNTQLLLNFTNAGILDQTGKNVLETVGNAQIDTTTKKYGTGSLEFDGTDDYLVGVLTPDLNLGTGDFTLELWIYPTTLNATDRMVAYTGNFGIGFYISSSAIKLTRPGDVLLQTISTSLSANTWQHIAISRSGTSLRTFVNGTQVGSTLTNSSSFNPTTRLEIGRESAGGNNNAYIGFIDDLRITKGVARYTANFTAPTRAHKLK